MRAPRYASLLELLPIVTLVLGSQPRTASVAMASTSKQLTASVFQQQDLVANTHQHQPPAATAVASAAVDLQQQALAANIHQQPTASGPQYQPTAVHPQQPTAATSQLPTAVAPQPSTAVDPQQQFLAPNRPSQQPTAVHRLPAAVASS